MTDTFAIVPASGRMWIVLAPIAFVLVVVVCIFAGMIYSSRNAKFEVGNDGLAIRGVYSRRIAFRDLDLSNAEVIDLSRHAELRPTMRTNGIGLPGYSAGWFRLQNGQKALLYVTASDRVVHLTTNGGYTMLLSVSDPDAFLESLRRHALQTQ